MIARYPIVYSNSTASASAATAAAQFVSDGKDRQVTVAADVGLAANRKPVPDTPRVAEPEAVDDGLLDDCICGRCER